MEILNEQWFDSNADRAYPLFDEATRLDITSAFTLPNDLIVDARIAAPANYDATKWYISQISAFGAGLVITIAVTGTGNVATVTVPMDGFTEFSSYAITPLPGFPQVGGAMVIGSALAVVAAANSVYSFAQTATQLLPTVIFPAAPAVSSITFIDSFGVSTVLTGAVTIAAGINGVVSGAGQTITIGMSTGVLLEDPCVCTDTGGNNRLAIKSINGVTPNGAGNLQIVPVGCPTITADGASLNLIDTCAQPCCGTPEITALSDSVVSLDQKLAQLAILEASIEAGLRQLNNYYNT